MARIARRMLVLGLDGATFDLLDPLMEAGDLPFLAQLTQRGTRARLRSVFPPKTVPAWYSFATGLDPGELGIFGFTEPDGGPGRSRVVPSFRPNEAVWDRLGRLGHTVGVLNFPLRQGYPVNGFFVPGLLTERPSTFPEPLRGEIESAVGRPFLPELPLYHAPGRDAWVGRAVEAVEDHAAHAEYLIDRFRPEFLFVLVRETDRVQHALWSELEGPVDQIPPDLRRFYRTVDATCQRIDAAFRAGDAPATTLVISDHGHGAAHADFFTNRWLEREGFLVFEGASGRPTLKRRLVTRLLLAADRWGLGERFLRPIADRLRGTKGEGRFGRMVTGDQSFETMAKRIDWRKTVAYSYPVPEGIYLNRYNPDLTPERGREVVEEIRRRLATFPGAQVEVFDPREMYRGANLDRAPALFLRVNGLGTETRMDFGYPDPILPDRPRYFYGSGVHRMDGIFIAYDDSSPTPMPGRATEELSLLDVAPTILEAMGVAVPPTLHGRSAAREVGLAA